ncbi:rhodanese-like domain-containing protein [Nocardioides euryhalodurans]|nr:rhodanese-like domain-containing protein [Nocardioides euryhalodurans]
MSSAGRVVAVVLAVVVGLVGLTVIGLVAVPGDPEGASSGESGPAPELADADLVRERIETGATVIDVRTPEEYDAGHVADALPADIGTDDFEQAVADLPREDAYVVYCATGRRAAAAVERMEDAGFTDVLNGGGFDRMVELGAPTSAG